MGGAIGPSIFFIRYERVIPDVIANNLIVQDCSGAIVF